MNPVLKILVRTLHVFLDRYLLVYKPVNATGARSLKIFPSFAINFLEMKLETETIVNSYY